MAFPLLHINPRLNYDWPLLHQWDRTHFLMLRASFSTVIITVRLLSAALIFLTMNLGIIFLKIRKHFVLGLLGNALDNIDKKEKGILPLDCRNNIFYQLIKIVCI